MTIRTTSSTVEFGAPFKLEGHDEILPAGIYHVDTDEEAFEARERTVYRRVATRLRIQTVGKTVHCAVDLKDLNAALQRDREEISTRLDDVPPDTSLGAARPEVSGMRSARAMFSSVLCTIRSWIDATRSIGRS
jgi:hypothetical protein